MSSDVRKAQNEVWFRELNERLELRALRRGEDDETFEVVCECSREECTERVRIGYSAYEQVRKDGRRFILVPGHRDATLERVVSPHGSYDVVEKIGVAAAVAEAEDPRG